MCNVTIIVFTESCDVGSLCPVQGFEVGAPVLSLLWWVWCGDETGLAVHFVSQLSVFVTTILTEQVSDDNPNDKALVGLCIDTESESGMHYYRIS